MKGGVEPKQRHVRVWQHQRRGLGSQPNHLGALDLYLQEIRWGALPINPGTD